MKTSILLPVLALLGLAAGVQATAPSPYAGQEAREIKSLPASEVEGLLAGRGLGYAKAAELNGYPGPAHVLELASQLQLTQDQVERTRAIHQRMEVEARESGARLVDAERELDTLFRSRAATPERLSAALQKTAALQAKVREAHLRAHIEQTELLSARQVAQYGRLRGYAAAGSDAPAGGHHHGHGHHPGQR